MATIKRTSPNSQSTEAPSTEAPLEKKRTIGTKVAFYDKTQHDPGRALGLLGNIASGVADVAWFFKNMDVAAIRMISGLGALTGTLILTGFILTTIFGKNSITQAPLQLPGRIAESAATSVRGTYDATVESAQNSKEIISNPSFPNGLDPNAQASPASPAPEQ